MDQFYLFCAVVGGTIFAGQFLMSLLGLAGDHDLAGDSDHCDGPVHDAPADSHHDGALASHDSALWWFLSVLSFRTIVAGITFFGLAGRAAEASGVTPVGALVIACASGISALYLVAWVMQTMLRLRSDGTAHIENSVGQTATVYLTIPGHRAGKGKITVTVQNRTMEYDAETDCENLPTGALVQIVSVSGADTAEVVPATEPARIDHA
jgi:hypothetical protein